MNAALMVAVMGGGCRCCCGYGPPPKPPLVLPDVVSGMASQSGLPITYEFDWKFGQHLLVYKRSNDRTMMAVDDDSARDKELCVAMFERFLDHVKNMDEFTEGEK